MSLVTFVNFFKFQIGFSTRKNNEIGAARRYQLGTPEVFYRKIPGDGARAKSKGTNSEAYVICQ